MKLLQLIQAEDNNSIYIKAENLITFSSYDGGATIELTTGSVFVVKETTEIIIQMLSMAARGSLTVINRTNV
jgi:hypothetical protein